MVFKGQRMSTVCQVRSLVDWSRFTVVQHVSDRVADLYLGRIVELGLVAQVFDQPAHPYTAALFGSVPKHWCVLTPSMERCHRPCHRRRGVVFIHVVRSRARVAVRRSLLRSPHLRRGALPVITMIRSLLAASAASYLSKKISCI